MPWKTQSCFVWVGMHFRMFHHFSRQWTLLSGIDLAGDLLDWGSLYVQV